MIDEHQALEELKYKQAMDLRADHAFSFARDSRYWRAVMPMEIDEFLRGKSRAGMIFYGMVDIRNTSFIFVCETFPYIVDKYVVNVKRCVHATIDCQIDYDDLCTHQYAIKIQEFVEASYQGEERRLLENIVDTLCSQAGETASEQSPPVEQLWTIT